MHAECYDDVVNKLVKFVTVQKHQMSPKQERV